jgi:hypothetical protein
VTLEAQIEELLSDKAFGLYPLAPELPRVDPLVTYTRSPGFQETELDGGRGLNRQPFAFVVWSKRQMRSVDTAHEIIRVLEAYTSATVYHVSIDERSSTYNAEADLYGFRVVATFITTED